VRVLRLIRQGARGGGGSAVGHGTITSDQVSVRELPP
jgi:hypothetical protein